MKKLLALFILSFAIVTIVPSLAFAAKPDSAGKPKPPSDGGGGTTAELVGYDISYPQCGRRLPTDHYFGIVGVNGGTATTENPCLAEQLAWANTAQQHPKQPKIQLYVNTANPAQESSYDWVSWPTSGGNEKYGECTGTENNSLACAWQYGWNRSVETESYFVKKAKEAGITFNASDYTWWLDVETMNSWQHGSQDALKKNVASLEGFAAYYQSKQAEVGLYSTAYQWGEITGNYISAESNLIGLDNWRPSGASLSNAINNCNVPPLTTGGKIVLTQYVKKNLDHNHSCI